MGTEKRMIRKGTEKFENNILIFEVVISYVCFTYYSLKII